MMDLIGMPFPTTIPVLPGWLIKLAKAMFKPSKSRETPQDVAERQRWRREFTDYVQKQATATEQQVAAQLRTFAEQLMALSQNELARYHISAVPFVHQVELLSMQIPGTIASEVSRRMTDSDIAYQKLCRMMPGAEKEKATQDFMREIIHQGVEKCSSLAQQVLDQLEEDLTAALQEKLEQSQQQLERTKQELSALAEAAGDGQQQEKLKAHGKAAEAGFGELCSAASGCTEAPGQQHQRQGKRHACSGRTAVRKRNGFGFTGGSVSGWFLECDRTAECGGYSKFNRAVPSASAAH